MHYPDAAELDSFPTFSDFAVILRDTGEGGQHVFFIRPQGEELAGFPAWDHADRDLRHFIPADVPLGTHQQPFDESDEGWRILIFERGGYVYIMQGDEPRAEEFGTWFRVPRDQYLQAWAFLIDAYNPITPLDDA